jgi:glycosyltransferase involved in cell wall biosynthesis
LIDLLVDAVTLSVPSSLRGLGTYVRALVPRLAQLQDFRVHALVAGASPLPATVHAVPVRRRLPTVLQFIEQSIVLPGDIDRVGPTLFHSPAIDPPRRASVPWVQTLLDVTPVAFPHREFRARRRLWMVRGRRIRSAAAVIAISQHSADDGIRLLGLDPRRIHVVHLGVDPAFKRAAAPTQPDRPFLLFVSGYGPHKGLEEAFAVIESLARQGLPHHLKVVGAATSRVQHRLRAMADLTAHPERIELLGHVSGGELQSLYHLAAVTIITSRYEGFCLPAVEAMASGSPVVAFDNSALPEVIGSGGVLVPDGDVCAFAAAVRQVLTNSRYRAELSDAGAARASRFDWDRSTDMHAEVFRDVARAR